MLLAYINPHDSIKMKMQYVPEVLGTELDISCVSAFLNPIHNADSDATQLPN